MLVAETEDKRPRKLKQYADARGKRSCNKE